MAKTKEEKREAWREYYKKNKAKYKEWARAYRAKHKKATAKAKKNGEAKAVA